MLKEGDNLTVYDVDSDRILLVDDCGEKHEIPLNEQPPMVLITVMGGVAEYSTKGEVDVELMDYDNDPDVEYSDKWADWGKSANEDHDEE